MRVYSKIVINLITGETECAEWTDDYAGPVAECKGGSGGTQVDKKYNRGMLEISREQQKMAMEVFNLFKYGVTYDPYKIDEKTGKTLGEVQGYDPDKYKSEMELVQERLAAESELLPYETELRKTQAETQTGLIKERAPVISKMYKQALTGVDVDKRVSEGRAGVQHAFKSSQGTMLRDLSRMGIDPSSGRGLSVTSDIGINRAKAMADVEGDVRRQADIENFQRLKTAAGIM